MAYIIFHTKNPIFQWSYCPNYPREYRHAIINLFLNSVLFGAILLVNHHLYEDILPKIRKSNKKAAAPEGAAAVDIWLYVS